MKGEGIAEKTSWRRERRNGTRWSRAKCSGRRVLLVSSWAREWQLTGEKISIV